MLLSRLKSALSRTMDISFGLAALFTFVYYWVITRPAMHGTLLHRYTTEHHVEYVIVAAFIWGVTDTIIRALSLPRESLALKEDWLPQRSGREPVSRAALLYAQIQEKPAWLRESRIGQRLTQALAYLNEHGTADEFSDYLRYLADLDDEKTHANYGLIRFICWVTPVLGFLGTVLHFGTALGGLSADQMADQLSLVVGKMGTAFNTTTCALAASTTMMFSLFLIERTEQRIIRLVDRRTERELLNRFEMSDPSLAPLLDALHATSAATLDTIESSTKQQMQVLSSVFQRFQEQSRQYLEHQAQLWEQALARLEQRFEAGDREREKRLLRALEVIEVRREEHRHAVQTTSDQLGGLRNDFAQLVQGLSSIADGEGKLVALQASLADNLRVIRETQQIDQALHGLTAAIHLLTARHQPATPPPREHRAA